MKTQWVVFVAVFSWTCFANVVGKKSEVFGVEWHHRGFKSWVTDPKALITPEVSNLAAQSCLRRSQEQLDAVAYSGLQSLVGEMQRSYRREDVANDTRAYDIGLSRLTELVSLIESIEADGPVAYQKQCEATVTPLLETREVQEELFPLYRGRLFPSISEELPPEIKVKLQKMARKGIRLSPLTWHRLVTQVCSLEGYYSTSVNPALWKFFSISRLMGNVLPAMKEEGIFKKAVERSPRVVRELKLLNTYSSVAGKFNGPTIGMTDEEARAAGMRLTGSALGSRAHSLLGFFTTAWREEIQRLVIDQDYPEKPFELISSDAIMAATYATDREKETRKQLSQSEWGMVALWEGLSDWRSNDYGPVTVAYKKTSGLAWLALNAETNVRQNEKIAGYEKTALDPTEVTTNLFGVASQYYLIAEQLKMAQEAFRVLNRDGKLIPRCVGDLYRMNTAAAARLGFRLDPRVIQMPKEEVGALIELKFEPVLVDIGLEVDDQLGDQPEGVFRLHLGTGHGREIEARIQEQSYLLWTPSSMVLHLNRQQATFDWQSVELHKYDPPVEGE